MGKFGFTAVIGADYSALNNAMKEIVSSSKKLNSELKQINSALKLDPENAVLAAQKLEVMGDAAKEAQKKNRKAGIPAGSYEQGSAERGYKR